MSNQEEPSYLMFARANARGGAMTSPLIVQELLGRIDRDAAALVAASKPSNEQAAAVKAMEKITATMDDYYRSGSPENQFKALSEIAKHLGTYIAERI